MQKLSARLNKPIDLIPDEVMEVLKAHDWPGNIRELQNFIERAVVFSPGVGAAPAAPDLKQMTKQRVGGGLTHACRRRAGAYPGRIEANRWADRRTGRRGDRLGIAAHDAGLQDAKTGN